MLAAIRSFLVVVVVFVAVAGKSVAGIFLAAKVRIVVVGAVEAVTVALAVAEAVAGNEARFVGGEFVLAVWNFVRHLFTSFF